MTQKQRITVSLAPAVAAAAKAAVAAGHAATVSAYVEESITARADRDAWIGQWRAMTGGAPSPQHAEWAMRTLGVMPADPRIA